MQVLCLRHGSNLSFLRGVIHSPHEVSGLTGAEPEVDVDPSSTPHHLAGLGGRNNTVVHDSLYSFRVGLFTISPSHSQCCECEGDEGSNGAGRGDDCCDVLSGGDVVHGLVIPLSLVTFHTRSGRRVTGEVREDDAEEGDDRDHRSGGVHGSVLHHPWDAFHRVISEKFVSDEVQQNHGNDHCTGHGGSNLRFQLHSPHGELTQQEVVQPWSRLVRTT